MTKFNYFKPVEGKVVCRFGTNDYIGAKFVPDTGIVVDANAIVRIPVSEVAKNRRAYRRAVEEKALIDLGEKGEKAFDAYQKEKQAAEAKRIEALKGASDDTGNSNKKSGGSK